MKFFQALVILALVSNAEAVKITPRNTNDLQLKTSSRAQSMIQANNQLFAKLHSKIQAVQQAALKDNAAGASLASDELAPVVQEVQSRWLGSIDKEEPEIVDEFLRKMKDAVSEVHATEGYPYRKVAKARDAEEDWLTKLVK